MITRISKTQGRRVVYALVVAVGLLASGCRKSQQSVEVLPLEGKVEKITLKPDGTGEITVVYFSEKQGQEILGTGIVTRETEIMINGAVASLGDIREGELVSGEVRIEKKGGRKRQIALKIYVDRPKPVTGGG